MLTDDQRISTRCAECDSEFTPEQLSGAKACPTCGTQSVPMDPADDVTIRINKHEIRILTMWATNYVNAIVANGEKEHRQKVEGQRTLVAIRRRIGAQIPELPLTLADEVRGLQASGVDAELLAGDGEVLVPRKGPPS